MKFEDAETWTQLLATAMALSIFFVTILIPIYLLCKYAFGIELSFMWFLDWHIAVFCIVLSLIAFSAKQPILMFISLLIVTLILTYSAYIVNKNSPYGIRQKESAFLDFFTLEKNNSYNSITIGETFCAFREYQGDTCKNYIHYVMGKEYAKAKKETERILKEKELEAIKQKEEEIKANILSNRLDNIISSYKGGENE